MTKKYEIDLIERTSLAEASNTADKVVGYLALRNQYALAEDTLRELMREKKILGFFVAKDISDLQSCLDAYRLFIGNMRNLVLLASQKSQPNQSTIEQLVLLKNQGASVGIVDHNYGREHRDLQMPVIEAHVEMFDPNRMYHIIQRTSSGKDSRLKMNQGKLVLED